MAGEDVQQALANLRRELAIALALMQADLMALEFALTTDGALDETRLEGFRDSDSFSKVATELARAYEEAFSGTTTLERSLEKHARLVQEQAEVIRRALGERSEGG